MTTFGAVSSALCEGSSRSLNRSPIKKESPALTSSWRSTRKEAR